MSDKTLTIQAAWSKDDGWLFLLPRKISESEFYALAKAEYDRLWEIWNLMNDDDPHKDEYARALEDLKNKRIRQQIDPEARPDVFKPFLQ